MVRFAVLCLALLAACAPPRPHTRSVEDLLDEPQVLDGVVARCNADRAAAARDPECENARVAVERLGAAVDAKHFGDKHGSEEKARQEILARRDAERRAAEAQAKSKKFDPYTAPVSEDAKPVPSPPKPE